MDTWWIDQPRLLGGANLSTADLEHLRSEGFRVIVSLLQEEIQPPAYDLARARDLGFERYNIPVPDGQPAPIKQLEEFVELMNRVLPSKKVIVHCQAGIGRTGMFGAAYWVAKGLDAISAITRIRTERPHALETPEQEAAVSEFARVRRLSA